MRLVNTILWCLAIRLADVEASLPRLSRTQKCEMFGKESPLIRRKYCGRSGAFILKDMKKNWTELVETEWIDNRRRLVLPYIIKPSFSDMPVKFWKKRSPGGDKPASKDEWISKIRPHIERAVQYYEPTTVFFKEYFQSDIENGRFNNSMYIIISDFYDEVSTGCTADVGPSEFDDHIEVDVEKCREEGGYGKKYHPGLIAHELMHVLGFMHEHQRPDRDQYLKVTLPSYNSWDYVKRPDGKILTPYDPESITHYHENKFIRINSEHPKSANMALIGQREKLSKLDIQQINLMYPVASIRPILKRDPPVTTTVTTVTTTAETCKEVDQISNNPVELYNAAFVGWKYYVHYDKHLKPEYAIDGVIKYSDMEFAHSATIPIFTADLRKSCKVSHIVIYPRRDCCFDRYATLRASIDGVKCQATAAFDQGYVEANTDHGLWFSCNADVMGTKITVATVVGTYLQIGELKAYCNVPTSCSLKEIAEGSDNEAGPVFITNFEGKVFDVSYGDMFAGGKMGVYGRHGAPNQLFKVEYAGNGYYFIRLAANSNLCLDVPYANYHDGNLIQLWDCKDVNSADNQLWSIISSDQKKMFVIKGDNNMVLHSANTQELLLKTINGQARQWFEIRD